MKSSFIFKFVVLMGLMTSGFAYGYGYGHGRSHSSYNHYHSYPHCPYRGCQVGCSYARHVCPILNTSIILPYLGYLGYDILAGLSIYHRQICADQYRLCVYTTPFYSQGICTSYYLQCLSWGF